MTYPGSGGQWQPNDPNQQGGMGSGPFPQQGGYPQQGGGYPQQGGYPQSGGFQQPGFEQPGFDPAAGGFGEPPKKKGKGPIIAVIAAVVVIALGVGATFFILNKSEDVPAAQGNPEDAATNFVKSFSQGDVVGVLNSLTPAESKLLVDVNERTVSELQRLKVYKEDVDPNKLPGTNIEATDLKYDKAAEEKVNDHLTITKLVDGKVSFHSDMSQLPLTDEFVEAAFPDGMNSEPVSETVDVSEVVKETGEPIRIATVKTEDGYYPSLFYTAADYALKEADLEWPSEGVADAGAGSADEAVKQLVNAALAGDYEKVIGTLPPDEMGALRDAAPAFLDQLGGGSPAPVEIGTLETTTEDIGDGSQKVSLKELEMSADGETVRIIKDGDCYTAEVQGETQQLCADNALDQLGGEVPPELETAVTNLASGLIENTGVVSTQVDGKWYVSPLRTYSELGIAAMSKLQPEDVLAFIEAAS